MTSSTSMGAEMNAVAKEVSQTPITDALIRQLAAVDDEHSVPSCEADAAHIADLARKLERDCAALIASLEDAMGRSSHYGMVDLPQDLRATLAKVAPCAK